MIILFIIIFVIIALLFVLEKNKINILRRLGELEKTVYGEEQEINILGKRCI